MNIEPLFSAAPLPDSSLNKQMPDPFQPDLLRRLPEPPRKIAIVRASRIGDFICATPAFRALRAALPESEITLISLPFLRDLAERSPHLDRFVEFPGFPGLAEQFFNARRALDFFQRMQADEFDLAIQMHGSGVYANPFALMLGAKYTAGFVREAGWAQGLDAACPMPETGPEVRRWLALTTFLGAEPRGEEVEFALAEQDHRTAQALLGAGRPPFIGIHAGAREETRRWAPERFAAVARELHRRAGGTIVVVGGRRERGVAEYILSNVEAPGINLAGRTTLPEMGAVVARLGLLVTNDSGPAHVAYGLGIPSVTIFGATDPGRWGPLDSRRHAVVVNPLPCHPCDYWVCPIGTVCLKGISVEEVVAAAEPLMHIPIPEV